MSDDSHDPVDMTPPPIAPIKAVADEAWRKAHAIESRQSRWGQFFFGSKETGPGWTQDMESRMLKVEQEVASQKFLMWKIVAAAAAGGGIVAVLVNVLKLFGN